MNEFSSVPLLSFKFTVWTCFTFLFLVHSSYALDAKCVPLQHCPIAMALIITKPHTPQTVEILRKAHCGMNGKFPKLRCDEIVVTCNTPDERNGTCTPIKECDTYVNLLTSLDLTDPLTRKYLREFQCDCSTPEDIHICCPTEKIDVQPKSLIPHPEYDECGVQNEEDRVVGGTDTGLDEFPWTALLRYRKGRRLESGCAGSLINSKYVVTAAHCVDPIFLKTVGYTRVENVVLGEYDTRNETDCVEFQGSVECAPPAQIFTVKFYIIHPGWNEYRTHDIGLIRLNGFVQYNDYVRPICLPLPTYTLNKRDMYMIAGWGRTRTQRRSPIKQKAILPIANKEKCLGKLGPGQICVGEENGKDACVGDSGGPLMIKQYVNSRYLVFLIGLVSYGPSVCGSSPGVYTYIPEYVNWIFESIQDNEIM